ncbi:MAG TPA: hypothetical protein VNI34_00450 [Candidatus Nitrosotalea sp.]|nr:hypothetical protein [Candidatus Nitrosotalea sp.]
MEESWAQEYKPLRLRLDVDLWRRLARIASRRRVSLPAAAARMIERQLALEEAGLESARTVQSATLATLFTSAQILTFLEACFPGGQERTELLQEAAAKAARESIDRVERALAGAEVDWRA